MKNFLFFIIFFSFTQFIFSQNITVASFSKIENSMTARIDSPKKDKNGDVCAIIKIVTTETGFTFEGDGAGLFATEYNAAEYWIWVGYGAKRLTIKHPKLGVLRDYQYTIPIEKATDYEMVLKFEKKLSEIVDSSETKWLVISATPSNSSIYINNTLVGQGTVSKKVKPGICEYHVEAPMYHSFDSIVDINSGNVKVPINLLPAFGFIQIKSLPEDSAEIKIDGNFISYTTPYKTEALKSGEHIISIQKKFYLPTSQKVIVRDNQITPLTIKMLQNYAEVEVNTLENTPIWINNSEVGIKYWKGRLEPGNYLFEAKHPTYTAENKNIELKSGDNLVIDFIPKGNIDVKTIPFSVNFKIDDTIYGVSPKLINNLSVGKHKIVFSKDGYTTLVKEYDIGMNQTNFVSEELEPGKNIKISSMPSDLEVFIDDVRIGKTPLEYGLSYGDHLLKIKTLTKTKERKLKIDKNSENNIFIDFNNKDMNIKSFPNGIEVYVDDVFVGKTPLIQSFPYGNHVVKFKLNSRVKEKVESISQDSDDTIFMDMTSY